MAGDIPPPSVWLEKALAGPGDDFWSDLLNRPGELDPLTPIPVSSPDSGDGKTPLSLPASGDANVPAPVPGSTKVAPAEATTAAPPPLDPNPPLPNPSGIDYLMRARNKSLTRDELQTMATSTDGLVVPAARYLLAHYDQLAGISQSGDAKELTRTDVDLFRDLLAAEQQTKELAKAATFVKSNFEKIDSNHDGNASKKEFEAFSKAHTELLDQTNQVRGQFDKVANAAGDKGSVNAKDMSAVLSSSFLDKKLRDFYIDWELNRKSDLPAAAIGAVVGGAAILVTGGKGGSLIKTVQNGLFATAVGQFVSKPVVEHFQKGGIENYYNGTARGIMSSLFTDDYRSV